jgi:hypothetical protein
MITAGLTTIGHDGQLIGDGMLQASVINFGFVSAGGPRGVLTIRGALSLTSSGTVEFDIGGTERGIHTVGLTSAARSRS